MDNAQSENRTDTKQEDDVRQSKQDDEVNWDLYSFIKYFMDKWCLLLLITHNFTVDGYPIVLPCNLSTKWYW
jgi:hypothetical protein